MPNHRHEVALAGSEVSTATHALRVAADRFDADIKTCLDLSSPEGRRLAEQFERQARESRALADRLEDAVAVRLLIEAA